MIRETGVDDAAMRTLAAFWRDIRQATEREWDRWAVVLADVHDELEAFEHFLTLRRKTEARILDHHEALLREFGYEVLTAEGLPGKGFLPGGGHIPPAGTDTHRFCHLIGAFYDASCFYGKTGELFIAREERGGSVCDLLQATIRAKLRIGDEGLVRTVFLQAWLGFGLGAALHVAGAAVGAFRKSYQGADVALTELPGTVALHLSRHQAEGLSLSGFLGAADKESWSQRPDGPEGRPNLPLETWGEPKAHDPALAAVEARDLAHNALAAMTARQRETWDLRMANLTTAEIAERMRITEDTVRVLMHQGRARARCALEIPD